MSILTTKSIIKIFLKGIAGSPISLLGALITATLFPILILYPILEGLQIADNPKLSFVVYGALTWLFILGHFMVFTGLFVLGNKKGVWLFSSEEFKGHLTGKRRFKSARKLILFVTFITIFNFGIIAVNAYNGFHYSESVEFCARLCHNVMTPEFTAYQNSPHSRVECVECHIGTGATWFVRSKLSGIRQLAAVAWDTYNKPIETPIHGLRPARETCEQCHRPELFHGDRLKVIDKFLLDEQNTHVQTVMLMKVGSGDYLGMEPQGSHWHVARRKNIVFKHSDRKRLDITEVKMIDDKGTETIFMKDAAANGNQGAARDISRSMDCLDCHNRPTHIYLGPDEVLNSKLMTGEIPRSLPYIKKKGLEVITKIYSSRSEAVASISRELRSWYHSEYGNLVAQNPSLLEKAIAGVSRSYEENVFPEMNIAYGAYERYLGHRDGNGCFRCHDDSHRTSEGRVISQSCDLCHLILAEEEPAHDLGLTIKENWN